MKSIDIVVVFTFDQAIAAMPEVAVRADNSSQIGSRSSQAEQRRHFEAAKGRETEIIQDVFKTHNATVIGVVNYRPAV